MTPRPMLRLRTILPGRAIPRHSDSSRCEHVSLLLGQCIRDSLPGLLFCAHHVQPPPGPRPA